MPVHSSELSEQEKGLLVIIPAGHRRGSRIVRRVCQGWAHQEGTHRRADGMLNFFLNVHFVLIRNMYIRTEIQIRTR